MRNVYPFILVLAVLQSCWFEETPVKDEECQATPSEVCTGFSWSFVDADTYQNIMCPDSCLIHPDSVFVLNTRGDTMPSRPSFLELANWWTINRFDPYDELSCFNPCVNDSAFSRFYFVYVGNLDFDTMEVRWTPNQSYYDVFYNGVDASIPADKDENVPAYSSVWFVKD
jgi:hypothetical protein